jgi:hypothetical protein
MVSSPSVQMELEFAPNSAVTNALLPLASGMGVLSGSLTSGDACRHRCPVRVEGCALGQALNPRPSKSLCFSILKETPGPLLLSVRIALHSVTGCYSMNVTRPLAMSCIAATILSSP